MDYHPINPVTTFVNEYGETEIIHRPKGRGLRLYKGAGHNTTKMNRAAAVLIGQNIKSRRTDK